MSRRDAMRHNIERIALDLIERFGNIAAPIACALAAVSDQSTSIILCAPFIRPLALIWPLTDCLKLCPAPGSYHNANNVGGTDLKTTKQFGSDVAHISCKLIEIVKEHQHDPHSVESWRNIADAIERLFEKPSVS
jgi:hypothetical protein